MLYDIDWNIEFNNKGKRTKLALMAEVEIVKDVDNLADVATIVLPESIMNDALNFENKIGRGTEVLIEMGYNGNLETEFVGFIRDITVNDSSLKIICEDALFLFRVGVPDKELKGVTLRQVAKYVVDEVDPSYKVESTYDITYEKFTIHQATGYDVLKKLQEETKGNFTFDTENKILHIDPPYIRKGGEVFYSMQKNIEESSLEYKNKLDYKLEVTVESTDVKGNVRKITAGSTGGDKITLKVGAMSEASMKEVAEAALKKQNSAGYEGSFSAWLIPYVAPTFSARIKDEDYPDKTAFYYVKSVTTTLSSSGGVRTVTPGIKLSE